ncbi:hypothetical protein LCGC14_2728660, partial [marine sediment metagenome]
MNLKVSTIAESVCAEKVDGIVCFRLKYTFCELARAPVSSESLFPVPAIGVPAHVDDPGTA